MLLIFVPNVTPRHQYVFSHIFGYLGIEFNLTNDIHKFNNWEKYKFSYSNSPLNDELHFHSIGLLEETSINNFIPGISEHDGVKTLFPLPDISSALTFDVFSAIFYMLSRYEEYLPFKPDEHGRFEAESSIAYKNGFLYAPVVDLWIGQLVNILVITFPSIEIKDQQYTFVPTYDIDIAWSYKHKGFLRNLGGLINDSLHFRINKYWERISVFAGIQNDPFDSYDYLFELQDKYSLNPIYFFHPGTYGKYDKNISPESKHIRSLLARIVNKSSLGIHPSYLSAENPNLLKEELDKMESAAGKKITAARQHFIRIIIPETYRNYQSIGITDDYSMGFATDIGFRAGTSNPFLFFDLKENKTSDLTIHPFVFMEGVFKYYRKESLAGIIDIVNPIVNIVKKTNGTFVSVWHNESLGTAKEWGGWRELNEEIIKTATNN